MEKTYHPKKYEKEIYKKWEESGYFNPDNLPQADACKIFSVPMAPVNVTGSLHMGHALENTLMDILVRKRRMEGYKTLWYPGTDHAGIATEVKVEEKLRKHGIDKRKLGRKKFLKKVWEWKEKYGGIILNQFKKLGVSCDWSRKRFTLDKEYDKAVKTAFKHYFDKGWIYRGDRLINWCPHCETALSDLEVERKEVQSNLWYIRYHLKDQRPALNRAAVPRTVLRSGSGEGSGSGSNVKGQKYIVVATTRPETMLGDTAIAVHPSDERYKDLVGKKAILPLVGRELPIVADHRVDPEFGAGALKVTPAHDETDWEIGRKHHLEAIKVIDFSGKMNKKAGDYQGLDINQARKKIVEDLKKEHLVEKVKKHKIKRGLCYRCSTPIEPLVSKQWFVKMDKLAQKAKQAVKQGRVKIIPKRWENPYFEWLENIRDWCISRQIWWGHRLPVWECQKGRSPKSEDRGKKSKVKGQMPALNRARGSGSGSKVKKNYFVSLEEPKQCPICGKCKPQQVDDVLDTWFSSALWPFAALGWPKMCGKLKNGQCQSPQQDLKQYYPANVITSAKEILFLWQVRMIFSGMEFMGKVPFDTIYIHPMVLNPEGKRMSKSLGTGIDPLDLIEEYGADAVRFGLAWQTTGVQSIKFSEDAIATGEKFANKVWNAARFVIMKVGKISFSQSEIYEVDDGKLTAADKKILKKLAKFKKEYEADLESFRFGQACEKLYHFFWDEFCDVYVEASKEQQTEATKKVLLQVLTESLKMLHPIMPHMTEVIWKKLPLEDKKEFLMIEDWPHS